MVAKRFRLLLVGVLRPPRAALAVVVPLLVPVAAVVVARCQVVVVLVVLETRYQAPVLLLAEAVVDLVAVAVLVAVADLAGSVRRVVRDVVVATAKSSSPWTLRRTPQRTHQFQLVRSS